MAIIALAVTGQGISSTLITPVNSTLPSGFMYMDIPTELLVMETTVADKLYMLENVRWTNNYDGNNKLMAGYVGNKHTG